MFNLDSSWIDVRCPRCGYETPIRIIDVRLEERVWCHGCHARIALIDKDVSTELATRSIGRATNALVKSFEELGRVFPAAS